MTDSNGLGPVDTGFDAVIAGERYDADAGASEQPLPPVTAAVTPAPAGLTPAGKAAALALVQLPALSPPELAQLAREIAMNIRPRGDILVGFKLTETQYEFLEQNNEFFVAALRAACTEWHAPLNTQERIKVEAAAILEDSLVGLGARMQNRAEGLPGVVEVAKLFAKVAGVGEREGGVGAPGERFVINIDLGGDKAITLSAEAPQASVSKPMAQLSVSTHEETPGD